MSRPQITHLGCSRPLTFLYQTRSIKHHPNSRTPPPERPQLPFTYKKASDSGTTTSPKDRENASDPWAHLYQPTIPTVSTPARPRKHVSPSTGITSPLPLVQEPKPTRRSAVTQRERQIFANIFESLLNQPSTSSSTAPKTSLSDLLGATSSSPETGTVSFRPQPTLPPSLRAVAQKAVLRMQRPSREARREDPPELIALKRDMGNCESDFDLLQWCEAVIFGGPPASEADVEAGLRQRGTGVAGEFYGDLIDEAMRLFGVHFKDQATVLALFEKVKNKGAESYVVGCTTKVYNRVLEAIWEGFRDGGRVAEVVEEMRVNGVMGDEATVDLLWGVIKGVEEDGAEETDRLKSEVRRVEEALKGDFED
ncbi:hypothetical protein EX30DRAFT_340854 [Ascodesmis nigricans]|uniref:Mtf2-like C-terminal domain-containing protein n=1 Tax=Ascodesmis nigricans TaxID=341454 RepID=A0A4S2MX98_9PEZI|nr:hypothetical protein EX30DRAFT_340854 [Ascodesmis nigricans]